MMEMNNGLTPDRENENSIFVALVEKHALDRILRAYPGHRRAYEVLNQVIAEDRGGHVAFTGLQVSFICDTLIPWAMKDPSLADDPWFTSLGVPVLDVILSKLRPPVELEGEVTECIDDMAIVRLLIPGNDRYGFKCPVDVLTDRGVSLNHGRLICTLKQTREGRVITGIRPASDPNWNEATLPPVEELPPDLAKALDAVQKGWKMDGEQEDADGIM